MVITIVVSIIRLLFKPGLKVLTEDYITVRDVHLEPLLVQLMLEQFLFLDFLLIKGQDLFLLGVGQ